MVNLTLRYGLAVCEVAEEELPSSDLFVVAVPSRHGMYLVCNTVYTAEQICEKVGADITSYAGDDGQWPVVPIVLPAGDDEGEQALLTCLKESGYRVKVVGGTPW